VRFGIPEKTRLQTKWAVGVWEDRASNRNQRLLAGENPLICKFEMLNVEDVNIWHCQFVLEVYHQDGQHYPSLTLYQLCFGLLCHLRMCSRADIT